MPEPESRPTYEQLFASMTAEYKKGYDEIHMLRPLVEMLRQELHVYQDQMKKVVDEIESVVRGNGEKGLVRQMDSVQRSVERVNVDLQGMRQEGTGWSRKKLIAMRTKVLQNGHRLTAIEKQLQEAAKKSWEIRLAVLTAVATGMIGLIATAISIALHWNK
jgi:hypothetical protein